MPRLFAQVRYFHSVVFESGASNLGGVAFTTRLTGVAFMVHLVFMFFPKDVFANILEIEYSLMR